MTKLDLRLIERVDEAKALVLAFNKKHKKSVVYLKLTDNDSGSFQLHLRFNDKFVDSKPYDDGNAYAYFSEAVYEEIQKLAGDKKISWNNTASIGWLPY